MSNNGNGKKAEIPSFLIENARDLVSRPQDVTDVQVEINLDFVLREFTDEQYRYYDQIVHGHGGELGFTPDELYLYTKTLIASRVAWVTNSRYVTHPTTRVVVPTVISVLMASIGEVVIDDLGVKLIPLMSSTGELMTEDELKAVSNKLEVLSHFGVVFATQAYERDKRGAFDLMALQFLQDQPSGPGVYSHTKAPHPAMALAAYLFQLRQVQQLLGTRVMYGSAATLRSHLRGLAVA